MIFDLSTGTKQQHLAPEKTKFLPFSSHLATFGRQPARTHAPGLRYPFNGSPLPDQPLREIFMAPVERPASTVRPDDTQTSRVRQGVTGHNLRYMLGWGLAGVVLAFAVVYFVFF